MSDGDFNEICLKLVLHASFNQNYFNWNNYKHLQIKYVLIIRCVLNLIHVDFKYKSKLS